MAEWKKVIVSGSNAELNNIFASGAITGSHISSSGDLFASLVTASTTNVVTYNTSTGKFHYTASTNVGSNTIGTPSQPDGTYSDGLLPFTSGTLIADAVDDINEVLAGLAPPSAPVLDYIDSSTTTGTSNLRMGFSAASPTSSYSPMSGSITGFADVAFNGAYATSGGVDGNRVRLGSFNVATPITIVLNNDIISNGSPFLNYPSNSFKANSDPTTGETYTLDLNGTAYTYAVPDSRSVAGGAFSGGTGATITLTQAQTGSYPGTGNSFTTFRHRTGSVIIPSAAWRTGSNFARISSSIAGGPTTYIDWIFDPAAASGNSIYTFNNFRTASVNATGIRWVSGVPYFTSFNFNFTGSISNYYKNTYNLNSKTPSVSGGGSSTNLSINSPSTVDDIIQCSTTVTATASNNRLLSQSLSTTLNISNDYPNAKSGSTGAIITPAILLDNFTDTATDLLEPFILETYRVPSASYDTQTSASTALNTFSSSSSLLTLTSELLVYSSSVRYPTQGLNGGNFTGITYTTGSAPNYLGATGDRWYFRTFRNGASSNAVFYITITGVNTNFTTFGGSLSGNNVKIWIKNPGSTGWRDISTEYPPSTSGIVLNDNVGARQGAQPSNLGAGGGTSTFTINLVTEALAANGYFVIRLQASSQWAGRITNITITGL